MRGNGKGTRHVPLPSSAVTVRQTPSTATLAPSAMNFLTVSGVAATRASPGAVSLRTAIFTSGRDQQDDEQRMAHDPGKQSTRIAERSGFVQYRKVF